MKMSFNGQPFVEVRDATWSLTERGPTFSDGDAVLDGSPRVYSSTGTAMLNRRAQRELGRFIRELARYSTPYAKGRGLKKPRGPRAKTLQRVYWMRAIERLVLEAARREQQAIHDRGGAQIFEKLMAEAGASVVPLNADGLYEVTLPPAKEGP